MKEKKKRALAKQYETVSITEKCPGKIFYRREIRQKFKCNV